MKIFRTFIFFFLIFIAQTVVFSRAEIFSGKLDAILCCAIVWGLIFGPTWGLCTGVIAGYFIDLVSSSGFFYLPVIGLAGLVAGLLREKVYREKHGVIALSVFLLSIFSYLLPVLVLFNIYGIEINNFWPPTIISSLLNAMFAYVAATAAEKIKHA